MAFNFPAMDQLLGCGALTAHNILSIFYEYLR